MKSFQAHLYKLNVSYKATRYATTGSKWHSHWNIARKDMHRRAPLGYRQGTEGQLQRFARACRQPWGRPSQPPDSETGVPRGSSNGRGGPGPSPCTPSDTVHEPAGAGRTGLLGCGCLQGSTLLSAHQTQPPRQREKPEAGHLPGAASATATVPVCVLTVNDTKSRQRETPEASALPRAANCTAIPHRQQ